MSDEDYINLDLETAEALVFAAGKPELAKALHHHAHGVRNLVQGEWGKSFVNSLEALLTKHIDPLAEQIGGLKAGQTDLQAEFQKGLSDIQATVSVLVETVDELQTQMRESQKDRQALHATDAVILKEVAGVKADVGAMQKQLSVYMAGSKRAEVEALQAQVREMRGPELPPEQRERYIGILLKMIEEWESAHPDDVG